MSIIPIRLFGDPILRQPTIPVKSVNAETQDLIVNLCHTMHHAKGIGLAAPQIGRSERIFVVDLTPAADELPDHDTLPEQPMVFINPQITWESAEEIEFEEGCLSIPHVREMVLRPASVQIIYMDSNMQKQSCKVHNILARVIQHEYDHLEGVLFTDHISPLRRTLLKRRLSEIARGNVETDYQVRPSK